MSLVLRTLVLACCLGCAMSVRAQDVAADSGGAVDAEVPKAPMTVVESRPDDDLGVPSGAPLPADEEAQALSGRALADPFGLELRAHELEALLTADASAAESSRTFGAVVGYVIAGLGLGSVPLFFAFDDGSGLFPILSILPVQLGALSLASAILSSITTSTEERRLESWAAMRERGRPGLSELARYEGFMVADADRARDARLFSLGQGIASMVTGVFTGIVGLAASRVELTQITLSALGGVEILVGVLQLLGALDAGEIEARPSQYEARTGVRLSVRGLGLSGSF